MTIKSFKKYLLKFIHYLVAPALSCGMYGIFSCNMRSSSPSRDQTQDCLHWERRAQPLSTREVPEAYKRSSSLPWPLVFPTSPVLYHSPFF